MKLVALLALFVAGCGSSSNPSDGGGGVGGTSDASGAGGTSGAGGMAGADASADGGYPVCPQHRVEGPECPSSTAAGGVLRKDGRICATCMGLDSTGQPTPQPINCTTVAGGDLCVASCSECS
jgi:hypothetical protein